MAASTAADPGVVGHAVVLTTLERAVDDNSLAHATLLSGPDGIGKTRLAERLAGRLLAAHAWPGGLSAHPDHWIEDSATERIGIDRVRDLLTFLSRRPYAGGRRIAVIARADRLTEQAANCLLKTLEEPPAQTHLVLAAAHPERLPSTILSRCLSHALAPVLASQIRDWLVAEHGIGVEDATAAAALSAGRPGRALELATVPERLAGERAAIDALIAVGGQSRGTALRAAGAHAPGGNAEGREQALTQVAAWTSFVRDVAYIAGGAPELCVWETYRAAAEQWAQSLPLWRVADILGRLVTTADELAAYAVPRLAFEVLFLDLAAGQFGTPQPQSGRPVPPRLVEPTPVSTPSINPPARRPPKRRV